MRRGVTLGVLVLEGRVRRGLTDGLRGLEEARPALCASISLSSKVLKVTLEVICTADGSV